MLFDGGGRKGGTEGFRVVVLVGFNAEGLKELEDIGRAPNGFRLETDGRIAGLGEIIGVDGKDIVCITCGGVDVWEIRKLSIRLNKFEKVDTHSFFVGENTIPNVVCIPPLRRSVDEGVLLRRCAISAPDEVLKVDLPANRVGNRAGYRNGRSILQALRIAEELIVLPFDPITELLNHGHEPMKLVYVEHC
jgi:hypothetical protein